MDFTDHFELLLMSVDGTDRRVLVEDYAHNRGIGPVWSPDGNRIVFQGGEGAPLVLRGGETFTDGEKDEVIIVTVGDDDPLGPIGTQTVLAPIQTTEGGETRHWLPATVSWAPDSAALRFVGWELLASGGAGQLSTAHRARRRHGSPHHPVGGPCRRPGHEPPAERLPELEPMMGSRLSTGRRSP